MYNVHVCTCDEITNTRPGRPPKRVMPFPAMSPQDAMLRLSHPGSSQSFNTDPFNPFPKDGGLERFGGPPHHPHMGAAHLMSLNSPAAQVGIVVDCLLSLLGDCDCLVD